MSSSTCRTCSGDWPLKNLYIADCGDTEAYLHEDQFFTGWTVLVLKRHATELFHLTHEERARLIEEVAFVARHLVAEFNAVKMNYELLGNQLPHIHWHLIPRLARDPSRLDPVWRIAHEPRSPSDEEREDLIGRLRRRLAGITLQ
ncbi:MAG TPA: HIT family protein [Nitrospiraceae bacterium]|nr:HIT family protein [Nitrospiraceae bacterium]